MLLYCMTEGGPELEVDALPPGVHDTKLESLEESGVRCFYARVHDFVGHADSFRADALRFHAVLRGILDHATIVPFRFPTLLETEDQIRSFLATHASEYREHLRRIHGKVQMEVRITPLGTSPKPQSGKEYMDTRFRERRGLIAHERAVFAAAGELIAEWRVRQESYGLRCYALVQREQIASLEERIRALSPVEGANIMVSGPWPPSEFLHVGNP